MYYFLKLNIAIKLQGIIRNENEYGFEEKNHEQ